MAHLVTGVALIIAVISSIGAKPADPLVENKDVGNGGEFGDHYDGDILLTKPQREAITNPADPHSVNIVAKPWPNGTVAYDIKENEFGVAQLEKIMNAMADIQGTSCITFRRTDNSMAEHTVRIEGKKNGCFSQLGYRGHTLDGEQVLNLGADCFKSGTIIHELLHTLGFLHMNNHKNRDDFITIQWQNVQPDKVDKFRKYDIETDYGVPGYDYESVMHFPKTVYSANREATIIPKENVAIGQRDRLSPNDILKLNKMYNCP